MVSEKDFRLKPFAGFLLVAPKLKIMYCPTTKVACSSIKMLLAKASGSYDQSRLDRLISPHMARSQTIHELGVSGLTKLIDMNANQIDEILNSPEWLRVYATRDPLARAYSAWENRIFSRAPGTPERAIELCQDQIVDGRVNITDAGDQLHGSFGLTKCCAHCTQNSGRNGRVRRRRCVTIEQLAQERLEHPRTRQQSSIRQS